MGNQLGAPAGREGGAGAGLAAAGLAQRRALGGGRALKSFQCLRGGGAAPEVAKVHVRGPGGGPELAPLERTLVQLGEDLQGLVHALPYAGVSLTATHAVLTRPYVFSSLHDRVGTRPFPSGAEQRWLAFQLLHALARLHERGLCHGDLKAENVLITSWGWLYVSDFAPFKPVLLPEDDPADFSYFFDAGSRRRCYLAPERFCSRAAAEAAGAAVGGAELTPAMDIFSAGCVLAELFLDGRALFDLSTLHAFRRGEHSPAEALAKIPNPEVRELILHMTSADPGQRLSAVQYLDTYKGALFPEYFGQVLHPFFEGLLPFGLESRLAVLGASFADLKERMVESQGGGGESARAEAGTPGTATGGKGPALGLAGRVFGGQAGGQSSGGLSRSNLSTSLETCNEGLPNLAEFDQRLVERLERLAGLVSGSGEAAAGTPAGKAEVPADGESPSFAPRGSASDPQKGGRGLLRNRATSMSPVGLGFVLGEVTGGAPSESGPVDGMEVAAVLACSLTRAGSGLMPPSARAKAASLLAECAPFCSDSTRLHRLLPYLLSCVPDPAPSVRLAACRAATKTLSLIEKYPNSDTRLYPDYVFPSLGTLPTDPSEAVRVEFASCLPSLAESARHCLDLCAADAQVQMQSRAEEQAAQGETKEGSSGDKEGEGGSAGPGTAPGTPTRQAPVAEPSKRLSEAPGYEEGLVELRRVVAGAVLEMATGKGASPDVRRALLQGLEGLSQVFGRQETHDYLLPLVITFLNDRDWQLRAEFFARLPAVCRFVGPEALEAFLLPCGELSLAASSPAGGTTLAQTVDSLAGLCRELRYSRADGLAGQGEAGSHRVPQQHKRLLLRLATLISELLLHSDAPVREAAAGFLTSCAKQLGPADTYARLLPLMQPYLPDQSIGEVFDRSMGLRDRKALLHILEAPGAAQCVESELWVVPPQGPSTPPPLGGGFSNMSTPQRGSVASKKFAGGWDTDLMAGEKGLVALFSVPADIYHSRQGDEIALHSTPQPANIPHPLQGGQVPKNTPGVSKTYSSSSRLGTPSRKEMVEMSEAVVGALTSGIAKHANPDRMLEQPGGLADWKPRGILVGHFAEHSRSVNCLASASGSGIGQRDLLLSGSDDGTAKVWDALRAEKDVSFRSRGTYEGHNGPVLCCKVLRGGQSCATGSADGGLHIWKPERLSSWQGTPVRGAEADRGKGGSGALEHSIEHGEGPVLCMDNHSGGLLLYGTQQGHLHALDFRVETEAYALKHHPRHGLFNKVVCDQSNGHWVLTGSDRGMLCLWDTRFQVEVHSWQHPSGQPIEALCLAKNPEAFGNSVKASAHAGHPYVWVSSGTEECALVDISTPSIQCVLHKARPARGQAKEETVPPEAIAPLDGARVSQSGGTVGNPGLGLTSEEDFLPSPPKPVFRALLAAGSGAIVTAGSDCCVRLWQARRPEQSYIVCGPVPQALGGRPLTQAPVFYRQTFQRSVNILSEHMSGSLPPDSVNADLMKRTGRPFVLAGARNCHDDCISDLAVVEGNDPLLVSASRDGVIKAWR